jgi:outer membrane protein TolC
MALGACLAADAWAGQHEPRHDLDRTQPCEQDGQRIVRLKDLEPKVINSPDVLIADADLDAARASLKREQAVAGWELFGSAGTGYYREPLDEDEIRTYNRARVVGGLSYPLLGSRAGEKVDILKAQATARQKKSLRELEKRRSLTALRKQYVRYLAAFRKQALSQAFLSDRHRVKSRLKARGSRGLLLESDKQQFLSGFYLARRNLAEAQAAMTRALDNINLLTNARLTRFRPRHPEFGSALIPGLPRVRQAILEGYPEIEVLKSDLDKAMERMRLNDHSDIQSDVRISSSASREFPDGETGASIFVGVTVRLPIDAGKAMQALSEQDRARLRKARLKLKKRTSQLVAEAEYFFRRRSAASRNVDFARQRVLSWLETLRERNLQAGRRPGDVFEKLQQARLRYYRSAMDMIEAQTEYLQHTATLLQYLDSEVTADQKTKRDKDLFQPELLQDDSMSEPSAGNDPGQEHPVRSLGFYVWNSSLLHSRRDDASFWSSLGDLAVDRLLVSFDKQGLNRLQEAPRIWSAMIETMQAAGIRCELLLGEPRWILPEYRQDLLDIIDSLPELPFDGLHLDLEPNQLDTDRYAVDYLLSELVQTLKSAQSVSPWPVGLSVHPDYLLGRRGSGGFGAAVSRLGLKEVAVMLYSTNETKTVKDLKALVRRYPKIHWTLSQSFESILSPQNSWASYAWSDFHSHIRSIRRAVPTPELPVLIQSLQEFARTHENSF